MLGLFESTHLKKTKGRQIVLKILQESPTPLSAEEIYNEMLKSIDVNLSTVYRILNVLTDHNFLIKQVRSDGIAYFQLNKSDHKHILTCSVCKEEVQVAHCPLKEMLSTIMKDTGYEITSHSIELIGVCKKCKKEQKK